MSAARRVSDPEQRAPQAVQPGPRSGTIAAKTSSPAWLPAALAAIAAVVLASGCGGADGAPDALAPEPTAGDWRSWVIESGAEVDVPPPPRHGSKAARQDADELRSVVASRSSRDEDRARALDREPAVEPWLRDVMGFVAARPKDPVRASRNYALVSVAMHDAAIAA